MIFFFKSLNEQLDYKPGLAKNNMKLKKTLLPKKTLKSGDDYCMTITSYYMISNENKVVHFFV